MCVILFCLPCTTFPFHVLSFITLLPIRSLVFQQIYWCPTSVHDFSLPYELQVYKYISFSHIPIIIFPQALSNIIQSILTPPRQPRKWRISVFCVWAIFRHNQTDILQVTNSSWILSWFFQLSLHPHHIVSIPFTNREKQTSREWNRYY